MGNSGSGVRIVVAWALALAACSTLETVPAVDGQYALETGERVQVTLDDGRELLMIVHSADADEIVGTLFVRDVPHRSHFEDPTRVGTFTVSPTQMHQTVARAPPTEPHLIEIPLAQVRTVRRDRWSD